MSLLLFLRENLPKIKCYLEKKSPLMIAVVVYVFWVTYMIFENIKQSVEMAKECLQHNVDLGVPVEHTGSGGFSVRPFFPSNGWTPAPTTAADIAASTNDALFMNDALNSLAEIQSNNPSPLDQFAIIPLIPIKIGDLYFSFTNPSLSMLLTLSFFLVLVHFVTKKGGGNSVPNALQSLVELIYDFVPNPVNEQIGGLSGNVKQKFSPRISVTFTFSFFRNPQGMIPYSFTVTSHFLITLGLSFPIFIGITIVGFQRNGLHFLSILLPAGVPLPLAPFLVLLELIPHCFRALSSGIRLFANMMAGHSSVKILSGSAWTMLCMNDLFYFIGDPGPLFIVLALTGPELGVAISQAHVSTISICIYLNDATNLHQSRFFFFYN
uniref:ATP synthase subunit a n=1 Tax=Hepatica maxima TaxID=387291 RepID=A0A7M3UJY2_9MAGN|nr:ATP synthase F0 subunit 6 [Hepatica maxima]QOI00176.1 ATP synthase F0 subunit 6 [Hepatica maxima]